MRGIIGRIEIDRDAIGPASEAFGVVADNNVGQFDCEFVKILFRWSIALLAIVFDASGKPCGQIELRIDTFQQQRSSI